MKNYIKASISGLVLAVHLLLMTGLGGVAEISIGCTALSGLSSFISGWGCDGSNIIIAFLLTILILVFAIRGLKSGENKLISIGLLSMSIIGLLVLVGASMFVGLAGH